MGIKKLTSFIILSTILLLPSAGAKAPLAEVIASADKDKITIGEKLTYALEVKTAQNIEVEFPVFEDNLAGLSIRDSSLKEKSSFGRKIYIKSYLLSTYVTGPYIIPPAAIKYKTKDADQWEELETNEVVVQIESVLGDQATDIKDIKGPIELPSSLWIFVVIAILVAAIWGAIALVKLISKRREIKAISIVPAHVAAYVALKRLKKKDYLRQGKVREYYSELSDIIRRYIEARFELRAPEMTTEEFLLSVKKATIFSKEQIRLLKEFLSHCDMVKFAKHKPSKKEVDESFLSAEQFIDQTKEEELSK